MPHKPQPVTAGLRHHFVRHSSCGIRMSRCGGHAWDHQNVTWLHQNIIWWGLALSVSDHGAQLTRLTLLPVTCRLPVIRPRHPPSALAYHIEMPSLEIAIDSGLVVGFADTFPLSDRSTAQQIAQGANGGKEPVLKWLVSHRWSGHAGRRGWRVMNGSGSEVESALRRRA